MEFTWKNGPKKNTTCPPVESQAPSGHKGHFRNLTQDITENMVTQNNLYASQCDLKKPLNVTFKEIEQFIGIAQYMAVFNFPKTRTYWSTAARVDCIANTMSVNRWETIKRYLHFSNNEEQIPAGQPGQGMTGSSKSVLS